MRMVGDIMAQLIKALIDTQKNSYRAIGQVNAGDDLELELEVKMNGQPIEFINPQTEVLIKKSDNNRIRQTKDIIYQDGKFKIKVDEQGVTYPGIVTCQLIVKGNGRVSTCLFYFMVGASLDREILQSISKVETLEQLDEYVATAFANLEEYEKRLDEALDKVTNGKDGATFIPFVDDEGNLSWSNDSDLINPNTVNIKGPKGGVGPQGPQGEKGRDGIDGKSLEFNWNGTELGVKQEGQESYSYVNLKGQDGADGTNGRDGITPNLQVGTVTTLEAGQQATVVKRGTMENPIFDFAIPKGETGPQGLPGRDGITIDDSAISSRTTWSSEKIEDFVHTNDDVVWSAIQGENLSIDYTKEGYLREVEIWGNTWQDDTDSKNLFDKDNINLLKETANEATSYTVEGNTVKFEIPNSINQFKFRIKLDRTLDISKSYKISYSSYRAFVNGEWISSGISEGSQKIEEGNIFNITFLKDWLPITKFEVTNLQIEEGTIATDYVDYHKADLSNIKHLGELYVDEEGQPILDSEGREQYKIEIESKNYTSINSDFSNIIIPKGYGEINYEDKTITLYSNRTIWTNSYVDIQLNKYTEAGDIVNFIFESDTKLNLQIGLFINNAWYDRVTFNDTTFIEYNKSLTKSGDIIRLQIDSPYDKEIKIKLYNPKSNKTTLLLPCQLMKVGDVADRLYWDSEKGKYIIEKNVILEKLNTNSLTYSYGGLREEWGGYCISYKRPSSIMYIKPIFSKIVSVDNSYLHDGGMSIYNTTFGGFTIDNYIRFYVKNATDKNSAENIINNLDSDFYYATSEPQLIETNIIEQILLPSYKDVTHLFVTGGISGGAQAKFPLDGGKAIQDLSIKNIALKETNDTQDILINTTMLATDEMFTMLEPLLSEVAQVLSLERSVRNPMVDMYVAMVMRGLKTIEQVPARYREEVRELLAQLEK